MTSEAAGPLDRKRRGLSAIRGWFAAAWEKGDRLVRSKYLRIRPRVSLLTGSVFVLLTLFLPIAYKACGPNRTGYEFIRGEGIWPGALMYAFPRAEWVFYILTLGFAVHTLLVLLASYAHPDILRKRRLFTWLFAIAGTFSLYVTADFFWVFCGPYVRGFLKLLLGGDDAVVAFAAFVTLLVLASCLRSKFIRKQKWIVMLFAATGISSLTLVGSFFLGLFHPRWTVKGETALLLIAASSVLYWLVPVVCWCRSGLSRRDEMRAQWPGLRSRIRAMYAPVVAIDCLFLFLVANEGEGGLGLWGFPVFFVGVHLMSLGYMQLARDAEAVQVPTPVPAARPAIAAP